MTESRKDGRMLAAIGVRITAARRMAGYDEAEQAAVALKIGGPRYRKYERGDALPPPQVLDAVCQLYGTTSDFLLFGRLYKSFAASTAE